MAPVGALRAYRTGPDGLGEKLPGGSHLSGESLPNPTGESPGNRVHYGIGVPQLPP
jgi:hypothetical protein